tara:strand:+ start:2943 stop:3233 length:291 start_codon:yes stop_codon:yes gene_type:complete
MKTNKKAVLVFAMTMIFSLGLMQGTMKKENKQMNLQQVAVGAGYMAGSSEGGAAGAWTAVSGMAGAAAVTVGYGALTQVWNPFGWVGGATAGVLAL